MKVKLLITVSISVFLTFGSFANPVIDIDELSASKRSALNLPLVDELTIATKVDIVFVEKLNPDTVVAVKQFLEPQSKKVEVVAARAVGKHMLLWIAFPEVADGGIDLIWSTESNKCVGTFLGGYRG